MLSHIDKIGDLEHDLVEANGVESQAEVEKSNGDAIEHPKHEHCLDVDGLVFEEIQTQRGVEAAVCHHEVPTGQRRR